MVVWADLPLQGGQSRHQQLAAFQKPSQASLQRKGFWASWNTARPQITASWGRGVRSGGGVFECQVWSQRSLSSESRRGPRWPPR